MISLILGILFIAFTVFACLPTVGLGWGPEIIEFLKGFAPVLTAFVGLIAVFVGIADIKDKREAKKEEKIAQAEEKKEESK
ncbi:MAG: hypothetical protein K5839_00025 [Treponemataceae bacterium]|nr:hypothetical protein [Treponemataceae bacterium]